MDYINGHHQRVQRLVKGNKSKKKRDNSLKVVYISSPMKVRTSASRFRSLVQQLTGKDSYVAQYMESDTTRASDFHEIIDYENEAVLVTKEVGKSDENQMMSSTSSSPATSSEYPLLGSTDNLLITSQIEEYFGGILSCNLDVLGSYLY
ncbi:hypothetical protein ABFS82_02G110000 [Erythranthe guttata]|nr:PREDICTED: uncharacterized protein LOC105957009 [Erythranthe guttata]|eukprot:XP_012836374.1 PREDICTED: uncharacterized protein LOC105957009 [Erythranthe guttata]